MVVKYFLAVCDHLCFVCHLLSLLIAKAHVRTFEISPVPGFVHHVFKMYMFPVFHWEYMDLPDFPVSPVFQNSQKHLIQYKAL